MKQNICKGITAVIALTMSITACTTQDEVIGEGSFATDPTAVRISASVGSGVFTRTAPESTTPADQQKFLAGDKIVLASTATGQAAVTYTLGTDGTTWTPETGKYLKWMNDKSPMNMEAFYPAPHTNEVIKDNNASLTTFTLPTDQYGTADRDIYIGYADYMTYTGSVTPGDNGTAALTMQRQTARVQVKITTLGSEIGAEESFQVSVYSQHGGIPTDADANKDTKVVYGNNFDLMKQGSVCTALVIPGTGRSDANFLWINRLDSDGNYIKDASGALNNLTVPGIPAMEAGKSYLYNLTVGKDKAEISSVEVKDWTSGDVIDDNGQADEVFVNPDAATHTVTLLKAGGLTDAAIATAISTEGALNIAGSMNDADIATLRTWADGQITNSATPKLVTLDLSAVNGLTELPAAAFSPYKYDDYSNIYRYLGLSSLTSVTVPDAVTAIGDNAFERCSNLKSINLAKVQTIGASAFAMCTSLTGIDLSVATSIGKKGFQGCTSLGSIDAPVLQILNSFVFENCGSVSEVNLPEVTTFPTDNSSFAALSRLTVTGDIRLPKCTSLMKNVFSDTSVTGGLYLTTAANITMHDYTFYYSFTTAPTLYLHQNKKAGAAGDATPKVSGSSWGYADSSSTLYSGWAAIKYVDDNGNIVP